MGTVALYFLRLIKIKTAIILLTLLAQTCSSTEILICFITPTQHDQFLIAADRKMGFPFRLGGGPGFFVVFCRLGLQGLHPGHVRRVGRDGQVKQFRDLLQRFRCHGCFFPIYQDIPIQKDGKKSLRQVRIDPGPAILLPCQKHRNAILPGIVPLGIAVGVIQSAHRRGGMALQAAKYVSLTLSSASSAFTRML